MKMLLWFWQLPQNILGFLLTRRYKAREYRSCSRCHFIHVYFRPFFGAGISLGKYIILDFKSFYMINCSKVIAHEHGHQIQSMYLGWFYLPLVGLPSLIRNVWDRLFHKKWDCVQREYWYYSGYPERWADELGGVIRKEITYVGKD